jgi:hypothetical protein
MRTYRLAACLLLLVTLPAFAQEKTTVNGKASPPTDSATHPVLELGLAEQLAAYGRAYQNPEALLTAARMLAALNPQAVPRQKTTEGMGTADDTKPDAPAPYLSAETLLAEARTLAADNAPLLAVIAQAEQPPPVKGRVGGPSRHVDRVLAYNTDIYTISFYGEQAAVVLISGDNDTDLDCYVYDENGNLITDDDDYTDDCVLTWVPSWTGPFTIKIKNRGGVYNQYVLATN